MTRTRKASDKRDLDTMMYDVERRLKRGLLTLSEVIEIQQDFEPLWNREEVETIRQNVADFFKLFGVHVTPAGIGYKMKWY